MSRPIVVVYFFEDVAHEQFVRALVRRVAQQKGLQLDERVRNATLGSRLWVELKQFLRDLRREEEPRPDVLIVVADGDCQSAAQVRRRIASEVERSEVSVPHLVCAVPDPHIERWYLEDQHALPQVLEKARPSKLSYKCERDRYKSALKQAIRAAGVEPILGGAEYGEQIAEHLQPSRLDESFQLFWEDLRKALHT